MEAIHILKLHELVLAKCQTHISVPNENNWSLIQEAMNELKLIFPTKQWVNESQQVMDAAKIAYNLAKGYVGNSEKEDYDYNEFKEAFSSIFRIELYRLFIARGQDTNKLLKIKNYPVPQLIQDLVISLIKEEFQQIQSMSASLTIDENKQIIKLKDGIDTLISSFRKHCKAANQQEETKKIKTIQNAALEFELEAGKLVRSYQVKYESNLNLTPFFWNALLLISLIGIPFALYSISTKLTQGHYAYWDKLSLQKTIDIPLKDQIVPEQCMIYVRHRLFNSAPDSKIENECSADMTKSISIEI